MKENATLNNILNLYESEIAKNVKNKNRIYYFEKNKMQNIEEIIKTIKSGNYKIDKYNIFMISEPKHRIIMALNIKDKIINHYIAKYVLEEKLTKYLDDRNIATRKNMGTDYGIKMIKKFIEKHKKYNNFYVLKMDISKYFYTIDHKVLLNLLKDKLSEDEYYVLKESLPALLDESWQPIITLPDCSYPEFGPLRAELKQYFAREPNFNQLMVFGAKRVREMLEDRVIKL